MSKGSGMGRKRVGARINKGMDKCDVASHGKQCGRPKEVSKGKHAKTKSGIFWISKNAAFILLLNCTARDYVVFYLTAIIQS